MSTFRFLAMILLMVVCASVMEFTPLPILKVIATFGAFTVVCFVSGFGKAVNKTIQESRYNLQHKKKTYWVKFDGGGNGREALAAELPPEVREFADDAYAWLEDKRLSAAHSGESPMGIIIGAVPNKMYAYPGDEPLFNMVYTISPYTDPELILELVTKFRDQFVLLLEKNADNDHEDHPHEQS